MMSDLDLPKDHITYYIPERMETKEVPIQKIVKDYLNSGFLTGVDTPNYLSLGMYMAIAYEPFLVRRSSITTKHIISLMCELEAQRTNQT